MTIVSSSRCQTYAQEKDYEVVTAENGQEALEALSKKKPDLILLDVQMPSWMAMNSYEETTDPAFSKIPVIVLSAMGKTDHCLSAMELRPTS